jgi:glycogen operon protein
MLSQGVPMLLGGDEIGRSQRGNNNAYCQDNEVSWFDWEGADRDLLAFTRWLVGFRRAHPTFRRRRWFQGQPIRGRSSGGNADIDWFAPDGNEMSEEDWDAGFAKSLGVFLNGDAIPSIDERGEPQTDDSFLLLFNAHDDAIDFALPERFGERWVVVLDTADTTPAPVGAPAPPALKAGESVSVTPRSLVLLRRDA